ncbi:LysR family transcriptional regulator [Brenneria tiliae]|uniref:LysR family transcriptional regulator n=1 Tax=Brenneria tiliae TaxID=2914984 RepID=A0ABT0MZJ0_9GAMM|nr:LysR family transcriptional regulator [Brenneria tiliae]MCL2895270.1 LysR family transcriptional regulator [Brenneria tiliae]
MPMPQTTLEQWAVLRTVVESGSFARAAEQLNRSQSSVSYVVNRLQERLGVALLRIDGRKARLTEAGRTLLADATPLIEDMVLLEVRGRSLLAGHEAQVLLLVDCIFPRPLLFKALTAFQQHYPTVQIELRELVRQAAPDPATLAYDLAISMWDITSRNARKMFDVELVAVAHHGHALHQRGTRLTQATLSRYPVVSIQHHDSGPAMLHASSMTSRQWRVNTVEAAISAVNSGLCYGWLPRHLIATELEEGRLVVLPLLNGASRQIPLCLSYPSRDRVGIATQALAELLLAGSE